MTIEKKIWPEYFEKILSGEKTYELRLADWECGPGDILLLREWDPILKNYTGRTLEREVSYVLKTKDIETLGMWTPEEIEQYGFQVIGLKN